jgi:hypothetical protein
MSLRSMLRKLAFDAGGFEKMDSKVNIHVYIPTQPDPFL